MNSKNLVAALVLSLICEWSRAETLIGQVVAIQDGDTLTVRDQDRTEYRIRLAAIDAPERGQALYADSKQSLTELAFQKSVVVEHYKRDRYGRLIGKVWADGEDVNLEQ